MPWRGLKEFDWRAGYVSALIFASSGTNQGINIPRSPSAALRAATKSLCATCYACPSISSLSLLTRLRSIIRTLAERLGAERYEAFVFAVYCPALIVLPFPGTVILRSGIPEGNSASVFPSSCPLFSCGTRLYLVQQSPGNLLSQGDALGFHISRLWPEPLSVTSLRNISWPNP